MRHHWLFVAEKFSRSLHFLPTVFVEILLGIGCYRPLFPTIVRKCHYLSTNSLNFLFFLVRQRHILKPITSKCRHIGQARVVRRVARPFDVLKSVSLGNASKSLILVVRGIYWFSSVILGQRLVGQSLVFAHSRGDNGVKHIEEVEGQKGKKWPFQCRSLIGVDL